MKDNKKTKQMIIIAIFALVIGVLLFLYFGSIRPKKSKGSEDIMILEPARQNQLRSFGRSSVLNIDENGNTRVLVDGQEYVISNGEVYKIDANGNWQKVTNPAEINKVIDKVLGETADDKEMAQMVDTQALIKKLDASAMTDADVRELAKVAGVPYLNLKRYLDKGMPVDEAIKNADLTKMTDAELREYCEKNGLDYDTVKALVEKAKKEGKAISSDEVKDYINNHLIEDMFDRALDQAKKDGLKTDVTAKDIIAAIEKSPYTMEEINSEYNKHGITGVLDKLGLLEPTPEGVFNVGDNNKSTTSKGAEDESPMDILDNILSDRVVGLSSSYDPVAFAEAANAGNTQNNSTGATSTTIGNYEKQNNQSAKMKFLNDQKTGTKVEYVNPTAIANMLTRGHIINATLVTGINTDLPGQIKAVISQDVYDSFRSTNILIPAGSTVIGTYDSAVTYGQNRVLLAWNELIRPDGVIIKLNGFQGVDPQGFAGIEGEVNNHVGQIIGNAALASVLNYALGTSETWSPNEFVSALASGGADSAKTVVRQLTEHSINRQPTIVVRGGMKISIMVNEDIELPTYIRK